MTTPSPVLLHPALHPAPRWPAVAREQLRTAALALRAEGAGFLGLLALGGVFAVYGAFRAASDPRSHMNVGYDPQGTLAVALLGLVAALGVWRNEGPSRRDYHWAMPVAQGTHTLTKALAGWAWLMGAVALFVAAIAGLSAVAAAIIGEPQPAAPPFWQWLVPFTGATVAYLLGSTAALASDHPWRWVGGLAAGYLLAYAVADGLNVRGAERVLERVFDGYYGLGAAALGQVDRSPAVVGRGVPNARQWLAATLFWGALGVAGVLLAARRRGDQ